jgi:hypothetical protein
LIFLGPGLSSDGEKCNDVVAHQSFPLPASSMTESWRRRPSASADVVTTEKNRTIGPVVFEALDAHEPILEIGTVQA